MKRLLVLFMFFLASNLGAQDWSTRDTVSELIYQGATICDWSQTSAFHREKDISETNQVLGKHPNQRTINRYFATMALGHFVISRSLHGNNRQAWQLATMTIELAYVNHNAQIGAKLSW